MKMTESKSYTLQAGGLTVGYKKGEDRIVAFVDGTPEVIFLDTEKAKHLINLLTKAVEELPDDQE